MGCVSTKKKLSKSDLEFLEENTEFTKDQIIEWYEGFIVSTKIKIKNHYTWQREREKEKSIFVLLHTHQTIIWFIGTVKLLFLFETILATG